MTNDNSCRKTAVPAPQYLRSALLRGLVSFVVFFVVMAGSMFGIAERLDWTPGWVFLGVYLLVTVVAVVYLWRTNPEVLVARSQFHWRDQTPAHKIVFVLLMLLYMAIVQVAAWDAGRLRWSEMPIWLAIAGYFVLLFGNVGALWVLSVNKFAEPSVSIQTDRNHKVVDTGPYAIMRHPLYAFAFPISVGTPLALCSYWAFVPAGLAYLVIVIRTAMEDRLLHEQLAGYREYAARVRYRLIPRLW